MLVVIGFHGTPSSNLTLPKWINHKNLRHTMAAVFLLIEEFLRQNKYAKKQKQS